MRLQLMIVPGRPTPPMPGFVHHHTRVGNNVIAVIDETDVSHAIGWAQEQVGLAEAEEYALAATTLEDVYIRLTGHVSEDAESASGGASS